MPEQNNLELLLRKFGWYLDRKIDISRYIEILTKEGYDIFNQAETFL